MDLIQADREDRIRDTDHDARRTGYLARAPSTPRLLIPIHPLDAGLNCHVSPQDGQPEKERALN